MLADDEAIWSVIPKENDVDAAELFARDGDAYYDLGPGTSGTLVPCADAAYFVRDPQLKGDPARLIRWDGRSLDDRLRGTPGPVVPRGAPLRRRGAGADRTLRGRGRAGDRRRSAESQAPRLPIVEFTGFPVAALDFYDDLEVDNTKCFWEKHKHVYDESVKAPMTALCDALGRSSPRRQREVFRPYSDVRFAKDKTPYKTHQGAFVAVGPTRPAGTSRSHARGVRTGGGFYEAAAPRLAALREAIATTPTARSSRRSYAVSSARTASRSAASSSRRHRAATTRTTRGSTCCGTSRSSPARPSASSR